MDEQVLRWMERPSGPDFGGQPEEINWLAVVVSPLRYNDRPQTIHPLPA